MVLMVAVVAAGTAGLARAALFFLFQPASAKPGDPVTVRLGGTPTGFTLSDRERPLGRPIRVYLVPNRVASRIRTRFDPRLHFVGRITPDRNSRGVLTFSVPPLDAGTYAAGAWCPGCARTSGGRTFFTLPVPKVSRFRKQMGLRVRMPRAGDECPVTKGRYGNGLLWTRVPGPDGVLVARRESDGRLFQKLWWLPGRGLTGTLDVRGERLDAPGRMVVLSVNWGYSSDGRGSWASAVEFPSEGCWRLTGRVRDVSLTYAVRVIAGCDGTYTPPPCGPTARSSS